MLSKKERKILLDINKSIEKSIDASEKIFELNEKKPLDKKQRTQLIKNKYIISEQKKKIKQYFSDYSTNGKRVFKHRISKKTQQLCSDVVLLALVSPFLYLDEKDFGEEKKHHVDNRKMDYAINGLKDFLCEAYPTYQKSVNFIDLMGERE